MPQRGKELLLLIVIYPRSCSSASAPTLVSNSSRWDITNGLSSNSAVTQSKIYELRARSYTGTSEDLENIFLALLLKQDTGIERGVELAAAVDAKGVTVGLPRFPTWSEGRDRGPELTRAVNGPTRYRWDKATDRCVANSRRRG